MSFLQRTARMRPLPRHALALAAVVALAGCTGFSADGGLDSVRQATRDHLGREVALERAGDATDPRVAELLAHPLSADDAVQLALLNNKGLQASMAELGIQEADRVQAGRLPNPGFSFGRLTRAGEVEIDRGIQFDLMRLLTLPLASQIETRRFEQAQRALTLRVIGLASQTRKAWIMAVAADESVHYMQQVERSAEAGAELARRMAAAGNWNKLNQAREQSFHADATLNLARALQARSAARERLARLLGVAGAQLPERLPDLPAAPSVQPDVEQVAMNRRLDVQAAKLGAEQTAKNLGLSRATRFVNVLELGAVRNSFSDGSTERGYEIRLELPLFDGGTARVKKAEALYMQALNRAAETALNARSEVREAYQAYRSRYDVARHYRDEVVPLKKRISDENLLRYNGMLIGVFELLADARSQIASVNAAIEARRDFWLAQADLDMALIGPPEPRSADAGAMLPAAAAGDAAH